MRPVLRDARIRALRWPARRRGSLPLACCRFPWSLALISVSVPSSAHYEVIRPEEIRGSSAWARRSAGDVATPLGNGVDKAIVSQHAYRASRCGACNLKFLNNLALGGDAGVWRVLARVDPSPQDLRYLPVRRNWGNRVNPVNGHIDNSSCVAS